MSPQRNSMIALALKELIGKAASGGDWISICSVNNLFMHNWISGRPVHPARDYNIGMDNPWHDTSTIKLCMCVHKYLPDRVVFELKSDPNTVRISRVIRYVALITSVGSLISQFQSFYPPLGITPHCVVRNF